MVGADAGSPFGQVFLDSKSIEIDRIRAARQGFDMQQHTFHQRSGELVANR